MARISVQDLKARLSSAIAQAESGTTLVITRHNEPVARLTPMASAKVHRGSRVGAGRLRPAIKGGLTGPKGLLLATLLEDRGDR
jgi:prevent-host-death family protein